MTQFNVRDIDLARLDSATKYPSIPTYHTLDKQSGNLGEEAVQFEGNVLATEKIDGTNARLILLPDGTYIIGSRDSLLYGQGDLIINPNLGIVDAVKPYADAIGHTPSDVAIVAFGEVYGNGVGSNGRHYSKSKQAGFRLFDVVEIPDLGEILSWPRERIASWRQRGGQRFASAYALTSYSVRFGIDLVPPLFTIDGGALPSSLEGMHKLLQAEVPQTLATLDGFAGRAEGIVLRDDGRTVIVKARFEDYERTFRVAASRARRS